MKRTLLFLMMMTGLASAGPILNLNPGTVYAQPGTVAGFGFTLTSSDSEWISVIGSLPVSETNPALGVYIDVIGTQGGPVNGVLAAGAPAWTQAFDAGIPTGVGYFLVDANAPLGAENSGTLRVLYEAYSDDPTTCGDCFLRSGEADASFRYVVGDPGNDVPEPATCALAAAGLLAILRLRALNRKGGSV